MINTVPLKKQSKRAQKEFHSKRRGSWYGILPVTRTVPSGGIYDRKRMKREDRRTFGEWIPEAHLRSKNRRRLRRVRDIQKSDRLLHIINYGNHATHRRYIDWGFDGRTLLHTGKYIKYPKNSRSQSWIKLETSRRIRSCRNAPAKGNFYRRLFDYIVMTNCQLSLAKGCKVEKKLWVQRKTVYYCKIVLQYAENGLEVVLTFRDDLFSCLQRLCGCAYILGQTTANWIWTTIN